MVAEAAVGREGGSERGQNDSAMEATQDRRRSTSARDFGDMYFSMPQPLISSILH
jgi:hypothetical protein